MAWGCLSFGNSVLGEFRERLRKERAPGRVSWCRGGVGSSKVEVGEGVFFQLQHVGSSSPIRNRTQGPALGM